MTHIHYSQANNSQKLSSSNTFKFMVSTDNHLGFKENHQIRKNDSFEAFEEVLKKAKDLNVDFLLLGGDLFHELNPSQESLYKCLKIMKEKIFGDKTIDYETFWDEQAPNYANENMNISLPIFIIHGNHDYPSNEFGNLSILDLLQAGNYVNYFGKFNNYENIEVNPVLFHKQNTKIALYGLGHIKDVRLHHLFQTNKVKFIRPAEDPDSYFHILVLHQNRYKGMKNWGLKNCIHLKMLPSFFNLIIWAHEHESLPDIESSSEIPAYIYQPGSSVQTSLIEAEGKPKHMGLFTFKENEFYFEPIFMEDSQRDLIYKQIELSSIIKKKQNWNENEKQDEVEIYLEKTMNEFLSDYHKNEKKNHKKLPLFRLKVEYSGFDMIRIQRLETKFKGKVANEGEILKFWKKKTEPIQTILQENENLNTKFTDCFKNKLSFNSLGKDSFNDLRQMYETELKKYEFKILDTDVFLEKIDGLNFRNRQNILSDFFESTLQNLNIDLSTQEKIQISATITDFNKQTDTFLSNIRKKINGENVDLNTDKKNNKSLEIEINSLIESVKKNVYTATSNQIKANFKKSENSPLKETQLPLEKRVPKSSKKVLFAEDLNKGGKRSVSTCASKTKKSNKNKEDDDDFDIGLISDKSETFEHEFKNENIIDKKVIKATGKNEKKKKIDEPLKIEEKEYFEKTTNPKKRKGAVTADNKNSKPGVLDSLKKSNLSQIHCINPKRESFF